MLFRLSMELLLRAEEIGIDNPEILPHCASEGAKNRLGHNDPIICVNDHAEHFEALRSSKLGIE